MESTDLRVFLAVAREGSITKAAARLGYVQSNVTARIQQLEAELQTVLFHRHNRGMKTTSSGDNLLVYAEQVVTLLEEASRAMTVSSEPSGPLRLGSLQTTAAVRLPGLLADYHKRFPGVSLSLTTGLSHELIEKVLHYELDGAFVAMHVPTSDIQAIPVFEEERLIVSELGIQTLDEALTKPILVFSSGCSYREILEEWIRSRGIFTFNVMEFGTLEAIIGGVTAGLGISLLPKSVISRTAEAGLVHLHPIPEEYSHSATFFVTRRDSFIPSSLQELIRMLGVSTKNGG
ncbi:HTH-type transcriptional regulator GltR [compost metagenome]